MSSKKRIEYYEYLPWVNSRKFQDVNEHRSFISREDEHFIRDTIYPFFINRFVYQRFESSIPLPLILKESENIKKPKFIVDNDLFTLLFYRAKSRNHGKGWVISFHIKEHWFCDPRIQDFRKWMKKNHNNIFSREMTFKGMPSGFWYSKLDRGTVNKGEKEKDFCLELFSDELGDSLLYKFCDLMQLFITEQFAI